MVENFRAHKDALAACCVLVVGDVMLDRYRFGEVDRISPEAPVPVSLVTREQECLGGTANVLLNIKTLGEQATLHSMVGQNELKPGLYVKDGDYYMETLEKPSVVSSWVGDAVAIPFVDGYSTTSLVERIRGD